MKLLITVLISRPKSHLMSFYIRDIVFFFFFWCCLTPGQNFHNLVSVSMDSLSQYRVWTVCRYLPELSPVNMLSCVVSGNLVAVCVTVVISETEGHGVCMTSVQPVWCCHSFLTLTFPFCNPPFLIRLFGLKLNCWKCFLNKVAHICNGKKRAIFDNLGKWSRCELEMTTFEINCCL